MLPVETGPSNKAETCKVFWRSSEGPGDLGAERHPDLLRNFFLQLDINVKDCLTFGVIGWICFYILGQYVSEGGVGRQ